MKNWLRGDLSTLCNVLRKGRTEGGASLFSLGSGVRTCGNGTKLCQVRFRLGIRKDLSIVRLIKHWNRLATDVSGAPCLSVQ